MSTFTRAQRLLTSAQFKNVFSKSKRIVVAEFVFLVHMHREPTARLGLAIAKKNIAKATKRNLIKRLCRESFRLKPLQNVDVIVLTRKKLGNLNKTELRQKLDIAWQKIQVLSTN